jgi:predicted RNase H-like HicB family nuclease
MSEYTRVIEQGADGGWGGYVPQLPGLGVAAETREETEALLEEGIKVYLAEQAN